MKQDPLIYRYKYLKYKKKYLRLKKIDSQQKSGNINQSSKKYLNDDDIEFVKSHIQFLTHATPLNNFFKIIESGFLIHGSYFDTIMMSVFPAQETPLSSSDSYHLPLADNILNEKMYENFNISGCYRGNSIILLFDPKLLWEEKYYYIASGDTYGVPNLGDYLSKDLRKKIEDSDDLKKKLMIDDLSDYKEDIVHIIEDLGYWPEIGFYEKINVNKYLIGIVIPKKYVHDEKLKSVVNQLDIRIFICSKGEGIEELNHL